MQFPQNGFGFLIKVQVELVIKFLAKQKIESDKLKKNLEQHNENNILWL